MKNEKSFTDTIFASLWIRDAYYIDSNTSLTGDVFYKNLRLQYSKDDFTKWTNTWSDIILATAEVLNDS